MRDCRKALGVRCVFDNHDLDTDKGLAKPLVPIYALMKQMGQEIVFQPAQETPPDFEAVIRKGRVDGRDGHRAVAGLQGLSAGARRDAEALGGDDRGEQDALVAAAVNAVTRPFTTYRGSCHCGAVAFEIDTDFPELTTCDCSICRRRNALMVKVHESRFRLLRGETALRLYRFHTMTAQHYFCGTCGIYPFHRKRLAPDHYGVNVYCLEGFDPAGIPVRATVGAAMD